MAMTRSPNFPGHSLGEAIGFARLLWKREQRTVVTQEVATKAWGHNSMSGPAKRKLGASRQYGLIEKRGAGVCISERALKILVEPKESQEYLLALRDAALAPRIFKEIHDQYAQGSDEAIHSFLVINKSFNENAARRAIKAYRSTIELAKLTEIDYTPPDEEIEEEASGEEIMETTKLVKKQYTTQFIWPLSKEVTAELRLTGTDITPSHIDKLSQYLELAKTALEGDENNKESTEEETN